jgi:hypothetical protein
VKDLKMHFSKEDIRVKNKHRSYSTLLVIMKMQIKTSMKFYYISNKMSQMKNDKQQKTENDVFSLP